MHRSSLSIFLFLVLQKNGWTQQRRVPRDQEATAKEETTNRTQDSYNHKEACYDRPWTVRRRARRRDGREPKEDPRPGPEPGREDKERREEGAQGEGVLFCCDQQPRQVAGQAGCQRERGWRVSCQDAGEAEEEVFREQDFSAAGHRFAL